MRKHYKETTPSMDPITKMARDLAHTMAERSNMNKEMLIALANAMAVNENTQRRFRYAVLHRLSRIEATVQMIHAYQIGESQKSEPCFDEKMRQQAEASEEYISKTSNELGLGMVKYIYGESEEASSSRGRKKNPADWEI